VGDEAEAKEFIARNSDATAGHNCFAWRIGQNYRFSDDGEPSGTAGKPILQAIGGQNLDHVAVVVSRWFGGVLLGSGGLIRAYGGTAAMCLRDAEKEAVVDTVAAMVTCPFGDLALLQARLVAWPGVRMESPVFDGRGAMWSIAVPRDDVEALARMVTDVSAARAEFLVL
jgi:putative IMPACT (imprinted ancient) family translation regulator